MNPTDEELMHDFYADNESALVELATRFDFLLGQVAYLILFARTGSEVQSQGEGDIDEHIYEVWTHVQNTRLAGFGRWPHTRLSVLAWILYLLSLEMDRHLGFHPPY